MEYLETNITKSSSSRHADGASLPYGPRSQGQTDPYYAQELESVDARISSMMNQSEFVPETRIAPVLVAIHGIHRPEVGFYTDDVRSEKFGEYMLELRELYRDIRCPGKRPWPAFMQAAMDNRLLAADCDALHALTGIHVVGQGQEIGNAVAGAPLDTPVLDPVTLTLIPLLDLVTTSDALLTDKMPSAKIREAGRSVAAKNRIHGVGGYRNMTRAEAISEIARRTAEIAAARDK